MFFFFCQVLVLKPKLFEKKTKTKGLLKVFQSRKNIHRELNS